MEAVAAAGVPALVYASSVGAYSPGPKDRRVDETWPTGGVPSSFYSRDKAEVERLLDAFEREQPGVRVVRLRPGLIFQRGAASEIRRLFAGPFLPSRLVDPRWIPVVPRHPRLRFQAVHADDVADAYRRAILGDARGAFNVAAEPVLDGEALGRLLHARPVAVPAPRPARRRGRRLPPAPHPDAPGWVDMALAVPLMDTARAREVLGWQPTRDAGDTLLELLDGMRTEAGAPTPHARARRRRAPALARDPQRHRGARPALTRPAATRNQGPGSTGRMTRTRQALPLAVAVLALAGCGRSGDRANVAHRSPRASTPPPAPTTAPGPARG